MKSITLSDNIFSINILIPDFSDFLTIKAYVASTRKKKFKIILWFFFE